MPTTPLTNLARRFRERQTLAESIVWEAVRNRRLGGWKWKRQVPRTRFVADFYCAKAKLVLEIDGWVHQCGPRAGSDEQRTQSLEALGLRVIRFTNNEVFCDRDRVFAAILAACGDEAPHPALSPLPRAEGFPFS